MKIFKKVLSAVATFGFIISFPACVFAQRIPFTDEEDLEIIALVNELGRKDWTQITNKLNIKFGNNRTPRQCRERYINRLSKEIHGYMTNEEIDEQIEVLEDLVRKHGTAWGKIAETYFPSVTPNQLKYVYGNKNSLKNKCTKFRGNEVKQDIIPMDSEENRTNSVSVAGFMYNRFDNPSAPGHCFWNILRKHMQNIPNADGRLREIAQQIGVGYNEYFDHFKLLQFFSAMNDKGYRVWYTITLIDWNHPEAAIEVKSDIPNNFGNPLITLKLAIFGNFSYEAGVDSRIDGHYVEAENYSDLNSQIVPLECDMPTSQPQFPTFGQLLGLEPI